MGGKPENAPIAEWEGTEPDRIGEVRFSIKRMYRQEGKVGVGPRLSEYGLAREQHIADRLPGIKTQFDILIRDFINSRNDASVAAVKIEVELIK